MGDNATQVDALGMAWGSAISVVATVQLDVALAPGFPYDHFDLRAFMLAPPYLLFWSVSACAALHSQVVATIPREQLGTTRAAGE